jgi:hypothetical protein
MLHRLVKGGKNSVQRKIAQKGELFLHKLPSFVLGGIKGLEPEAQVLFDVFPPEGEFRF